MIIEIVKIGHKTDSRVVFQIHSFLEKGEQTLLQDGNTYLDLPLPQPFPLALYRNAHGTIPSNVRWKQTAESGTPTAYKPFFFPRNPKARLQDHYAGKTCIYLRVPGIILLGYINQSQITQFETWYKKMELMMPELIASSGNIDETGHQTVAQPIIQSRIETKDKSLDTGIGLRALEF